ncbi:MAG: hypothetical protein J1E33_02580 [Alistipes sp.]|nr:hypothetical protein [Alistipes sp.]
MFLCIEATLWSIFLEYFCGDTDSCRWTVAGIRLLCSETYALLTIAGMLPEILPFI